MLPIAGLSHGGESVGHRSPRITYAVRSFLSWHRFHPLIQVFSCKIDIVGRLPQFQNSSSFAFSSRTICAGLPAAITFGGIFCLNFTIVPSAIIKTFSYFGPDTEDGTHTDNCLITDIFSMNHRTVTNGNSCPDPVRVAGRSVNDRPLFTAV